MKIFIENPADQTLVAVKDWKKSENPFEAKFVILMVSDTEGIRISKNECAGRYEFKEAQEAAAEVLAPDGQSMRCPTRRECLDIYDARFQGLDEAIEAIGGQRLDEHYIWTCESDPDPQYSSNYAFVFSGNDGILRINSKCSSHSVRPVTAFQIVK